MLYLPKLAIKEGSKAVKEDFPEAFKWPIITEKEKKAVVDLMESGNPYESIAEFEEVAAKYFGVKYALAQNNGTSTLHAAYFATGVGPGDEVITPSHGWLLQAIPIRALGAIPVFADIDSETLTLDPKDIEHRITKKTKAIVLIHTYGHPAEMDEIMDIGKEHDLPVIEDCSHAHGAKYKGQKVGTIGDIGCFSLQNSKPVPAIEGGLVLTNNEEFYERAVMLGHYKRVPELKNEKYRRLSEGIIGMVGWSGACFGFKYRINPLGAAMATVQLKHLDERNTVIRRNMDYITKGLSNLEAIQPPTTKLYVEMCWYAYHPRYYPEKLNGIQKSIIVKALQAEGVRITERSGLLPLHKTELFRLSLKEIYGKGAPSENLPTYQEGELKVSSTINEKLMQMDVIRNKCPKEFLDQNIDAFHKVIEGKDELLVNP